jgi:iron complex outermembrane receptor protein
LPIVNEIDYLSQEIRFEFSGENVDAMAGIYYQDWEESQPSETAFKAFNPALGQYVVLTQAVGKAISEIQTYSGFADATWHVNSEFDVFGGLRLTQEKGNIDYARRDLTVVDTSECVTYTDREATFTENSAACTGLAPGSGILANSATSFKRSDTINDWSARAGVNWAYSEEVNIYASVSRSFVGLAFDVGRTASEETAILDPTSSVAYEIGVKTKLLDNTMSLNANVFIQNTKDLQLTATKPSSVDSIALNAGNIKARGVEVNLSWQATNNLRLDFAGNYIDSELGSLINSCYFGQTVAQGCAIDNDNNGTNESQDLKGASAIQTPEFSFSAGARYDIPMPDSVPLNAYIAGAYTWQDDVQYTLFNDPETVQEAYGLLDVSFGISDLDETWEVSVFGKNVTDKEFFDGKSEGTGSLGRVYVRVPRGAKTYWGLRGNYRF